MSGKRLPSSSPPQTPGSLPLTVMEMFAYEDDSEPSIIVAETRMRNTPDN
jgi:hypothetical protein